MLKVPNCPLYTQEIILSAFFKILVRKANVNSGIKMEMMMWSVSSHCKRLSIDGDCVWVNDVITESTSPRPAGTWSAPRVQQVVVPFAWPVWLPFGPFCVTWSFTVRYTALTLNNETNRTSFNKSMGFFCVALSHMLPPYVGTLITPVSFVLVVF